MKPNRSVAVLVVAATIAVVAWVALPSIGFRASQDPEIKNLNTVRQLAIACAAFATEHNESYPPSVDALAPEIVEPEYLANIRYHWDGVSKRKYDFLYFHGLSRASDSNLPLIAAPGPIDGKRIVVRVDGKQGRFPEQSYLEMKNQYYAQPHGGVERPTADAPGRRSP